MGFKHFSHEHVLDWDGLPSEFSCNMCNRKIRTGEFNYICFVCLNCFIHKECAERPKQIKHHTLHPHHSLLLAKRSLNDTSCCYYCQKPFDNDEFVYACDQLCSDSYMHMACAVIPLPTLTSDVVDGGQDRSFVRYACHEEAMTLVEHPDWVKREAKCFACQSGWSGPAYSCKSEMCENFLHKACVELPQKIQPAFHPHHSLILQVIPPRSCRRCCKKDCRVMYSCHEDGCNLNLCIECRSLDTRVRSRRHDHLLSLVEKSSCEIQCDACQDSYDHKKNMVEAVPEEFELTRSIIFRCMDCVFNIHFLCGPLPSIIRYEHHIHPLILSDHSTIEDDSDEYYCDVCEKESDQAFRIYCCEECKYVSHIHCLFHEVCAIF
ncbi:hypothetical protein TIFTF001_027057 [Ficus carica]|uniref:DC1 domain-containing protein n=1 Tax=Ficus carica TaxID=3494 RepID=A0AA88DME9_FICCA|nr:hypothetical protein TIFTF001_027057 [Ficus carica]